VHFRGRISCWIPTTRASKGTLNLQQAIGATAVPVALPEDVKDPAELALRPDGQAIFAEALLRAVDTPAPAESSYTAREAGP
jgi:hypothetical protein